MKALVFPGQGAQFPGMGKGLFDSSEKAARLFEEANEILGFRISDIMFEGDAESLLETKVTQPAVFLHSVIKALCDFNEPFDMVAGHSLGEFSALAASGSLSFEDGLRLVSMRAQAMQKACDTNPGTMAAIVGIDTDIIAQVCSQSSGIVVPANFNSPIQTVISGEIDAVNEVCREMKERGARRALVIKVGGAFHSPLMEPARKKLADAISDTTFKEPVCPIYQNADGKPHIRPEEIKANLLIQLTSPVLWTQTVNNMVADGADTFVEVGPGTVLQGLIKKTVPTVTVSGIS